MTRMERIAFNKSLGLSATKFEAMTDAEYERMGDFLAEKELRTRAMQPRRELDIFIIGQ